MLPATTVIWLVVSVPVLSLHTVVTPPMVSEASRWRTRFLSRIMCFMLYAKATVTAKGRPSGTATTTMDTAMTAKATTFSTASPASRPPSESDCRTKYLMTCAVRMNSAAARPSQPMRFAMTPSFSCSGVSGAAVRSVSMMRPLKELTPTATTSMRPVPAATSVPDSRNGSTPSNVPGGRVDPVPAPAPPVPEPTGGIVSGILRFLICWLSPVAADSSVVMPWFWVRMPSAGITSPVFSCTISPTTKSCTDTTCEVPPRTTFTS